MTTVKPGLAKPADNVVMRLTSSSDGRGKSLSAAIAEWAGATPGIRRVWMLATAATADAIELLAELEPSADGEEGFALWLAKGGRWRREVQARLGETVSLDWFDPDGATRPAGEAKTLVYARL